MAVFHATLWQTTNLVEFFSMLSDAAIALYGVIIVAAGITSMELVPKRLAATLVMIGSLAQLFEHS